jgi:hypothetical protein
MPEPLKEIAMKKYLCVFTGSPGAMESFQTLPEAERERRHREGFAGWKKWMEDHAGRIDETGGPLSRTKRVDRDGVHDVRNNLAAFVVVEAESQEAAAQMFLKHPHFMLFPGDGVEVMEVLPIPAG